MGSLPWVAGGIVAAGIIHILCILGMPMLAGKDAWTRLSAVMKPNVLSVTDNRGAARLPFTSPDIVTAYCLFDVSQNNVIIKSPLPEAAWSLAVSTRAGENFYLVTGADAKKPNVRLLVIRRDRLPEEASTEKTEEGDDQNIIVAPSDTGIVAIRAPLRGESFRAATLEVLRKARCEIQVPIEPVVAATDEPILDAGGNGDADHTRQRRRKRR